MIKIMEKKKATAAMSYVMLFVIVLVMMTVVLYLAQSARLMSHQRHIDDSLTDAVLASLVADDTYYFETGETRGVPTVRFQSTDDSFHKYKEAMDAAVSNTPGYYCNFHYDEFICYEVEGNAVTVTTFSGDSGRNHVTRGRLGSVRTPKGNVVKESSAYGRVRFDIKNIIDGSLLTKTKDSYCTLEINPRI